MSGVLAKMKTRTPNCSAFPFDFRNKMTSRIGQLTPVACIEMGPNDRLKMSMAQLTRLMPMSAPAMANFQLHVDSVFVPSRIVAKKYEKFFNAGTTDADRPYFPSLTYHQYTDIFIHNVGAFKKSLLDYFGYPTFENVRSFYRNMITSFSEISGDYTKAYFVPDQTVSLVNTVWVGAFYPIVSSDDNTCYDEDGKFTKGVDGDTVADAPWYLKSSNNQVFDLLTWLVCTDMSFAISADNAKEVMSDFLLKYGLDQRYTDFYLVHVSSLTQENIITTWLNANHKHMDELLDEYFSYCVKTWNIGNSNRFYSGVHEDLPSYRTFEQLLYYKDDQSMTESLKIRDKKISLLPIFSFWKCYFDWYVNSVLEHGEELTDAWSNFVNMIIINNSIDPILSSFSVYEDTSGFGVSDAVILSDFFGNSSYEDFAVSTVIFNLPSRLWSVDRFTGAYTDTQNGQAVLIPTEGTIRDLKASNQLQRYLEKALFGGTRTIDKNELIYGAHSSNQLLDRTEVLSRKKFNIDIQQVTNSAASSSFDLGTLAGNGFGMGSNFLFDYTCEERGYVMIFASVVLPPSYVQALDRNLLHTDYYDFVIPEFDSVGEQEINPEELYFDKGMVFDPVGYNRRYYESIDFLSSVHGDFKNTLKHWHDARYFKNCPTLSPEFIRIDPENDDLERIFASYNHDQILHFFAFSGAVVRPMSKYVQFGAF